MLLAAYQHKGLELSLQEADVKDRDGCGTLELAGNLPFPSPA